MTDLGRSVLPQAPSEGVVPVPLGALAAVVRDGDDTTKTPIEGRTVEGGDTEGDARTDPGIGTDQGWATEDACDGPDRHEVGGVPAEVSPNRRVGGRGVAALTASILVRACDLRMGDVLCDTGAMVLGEGWPKAGRGGHVFSVFTNLGERIWPNDHRFNNIEIRRP